MSAGEKRQAVNKLLADFVSSASKDFMDLSNELKSLEAKKELIKKVDKLFKSLMEFNRSLSGEFNKTIETYENFENLVEKINDEKTRLERLYASGILFQSETDMRKLMEIAIETVIKELNADEGFIILFNEKNEVVQIVSKNMDTKTDENVKNISTTIVNNTVKSGMPLKLDDLKATDDYALKNSIVSLGLTSALSVPLISNGKNFGVVYIDRKKNDKPFKESDLTFLISFGKQIVNGMKVSLEITELEEKLADKFSVNMKKLRDNFESADIIGTGKKLFDVLKLAAKVSDTDVSVLLLGENGTGKDLLARAIHLNSSRRDKPFVAVNCSAIPHDLLESELFGYESGAFTGAVKSKQGKLESADGGTVFLDEIGEMSVNLQAKLLRVIQTKEIERLGSVGTKKFDVRFIAATNKNISQMIKEKKFREDLYYRLKVIEIKIPPLRERKEDMKELVKFFVNKYSPKENKYTITDNALNILENYNWPGNIRELENVIQRAVILAKSNTIDTEDLPAEIIEEEEIHSSVDESVKKLNDAENEFRKLYITKILRNTNSKSEAANLLGINRSHLHRLISQLEIGEQ